jgi:ubiquinone/menaquinone biosynthesis C-methylase UbiE
MLHYAQQRAKKLQFPVRLFEMDCERLHFPDASFDFVVATCVFCSVPDPVKGLTEIRRVLKPDGKVHLLEHMRSENKAVGWLMDVFNPLAVRLTGANLNRRTMQNIERAGFHVIEQKWLFSSIFRFLVLRAKP